MSEANRAIDTDETMNLVVLRGAVRSEPVERTLPSGSLVVQFDISAPLDGSAASAPVSITEPARAVLDCLEAGANVVVLGGVRRRFFRSGGTTQSRTEVIATRVVPVRRRAAVAKLLAEASATLTT